MPEASLRSAPLSVNASNYVTIPSDFPTITVTVPANNAAAGLLFAATFALAPGVSSYLMILDNSGQPVYYQKTPPTDGLTAPVTDFKLLGDGTLAYYQESRNAYVIMNNSYQELGTVHSGANRPWLDEHELEWLNNGHYLVMAKQVDVNVPGVDPSAQVLQEVIQEVDMAGTVYWEWPILDYVPVTQSTEPLTGTPIDYSHCNAIEADSDGNLLYSCRHLDSIIKIDRATKNILWQLGGKRNDFVFVIGPGVSPAEPMNFYHQHDIRRLPNGNISLFDNHNGKDLPLSSRVLEYSLDEVNKTATLVKVYRNTPNVYTGFMGSGQLMPNGNMFIGWGGNSLTPSLTEFQADGLTKAFELEFSPSVSYRAFRYPWTATPAWPPALVLQPSGGGIVLTFSWNGWTETAPAAGYRVYGGNSNTQPPSTLLGEVARAGFETSLPLGGGDASYCFYRVVPVGSQGNGVPSAIALNLPRGAPSCFQKTMLPFIPR